MQGLPPDAATWRKDRLPPAEEFAALALERADTWARIHVDLMTGKRVRIPAPIEIRRPGDEPPERKIVRDPRELAAWFARNVGGG